MRHLFSTRLRVILIIALVLSIGLTIVSGAVNQSVPSLLVQGMLAPVKAGAKALTKQAEQFYGYMFNYESLAAENEALKARIADMEDEARKSDSFQRENQRLRNMLDLTSTREDFVLVDAYIIAWSSTDWSSTLTINKGTDAGINLDMCAITDNGEVVGLVTEVGSNFAVIKTVLDSSLEISATIADSGYRGMVTGGYTDGRKDLLKMDYLPSGAIIRNNDQVVTSGSTVYPRNLIMGHIIDAGFDETGVAKYAMIEPAAELGRLEQVFIITQYTTEVTGGKKTETPVEATEESTQGVG